MKQDKCLNSKNVEKTSQSSSSRTKNGISTNLKLKLKRTNLFPSVNPVVPGYETKNPMKRLKEQSHRKQKTRSKKRRHGAVDHCQTQPLKGFGSFPGSDPSFQHNLHPTRTPQILSYGPFGYIAYVPHGYYIQQPQPPPTLSHAGGKCGPNPLYAPPPKYAPLTQNYYPMSQDLSLDATTKRSSRFLKQGRVRHKDKARKAKKNRQPVGLDLYLPNISVGGSYPEQKEREAKRFRSTVKRSNSDNATASSSNTSSGSYDSEETCSDYDYDSTSDESKRDGEQRRRSGPVARNKERESEESETTPHNSSMSSTTIAAGDLSGNEATPGSKLTASALDVKEVSSMVMRVALEKLKELDEVQGNLEAASKLLNDIDVEAVVSRFSSVTTVQQAGKLKKNDRGSEQGVQLLLNLSNHSSADEQSGREQSIASQLTKKKQVTEKVRVDDPKGSVRTATTGSQKVSPV